jgi:hypothetical protein
MATAPAIAADTEGKLGRLPAAPATARTAVSAAGAPPITTVAPGQAQARSASAMRSATADSAARDTAPKSSTTISGSSQRLRVSASCRTGAELASSTPATRSITGSPGPAASTSAVRRLMGRTLPRAGRDVAGAGGCRPR